MYISEKRAWVWLWVSIVVIGLDQWTKSLATHYLSYGQPVSVFPFLNWWLKYNTGAAFSFLGSSGGWQVFLLAGISVIVAAVILAWLGKLKRSDRLMAWSLSLILGGAIGNLIDRLRYQYVIDFIDFHIKQWHFATFNVADSAICVGAGLLIIKLLVSGVRRPSV